MSGSKKATRTEKWLVGFIFSIGACSLLWPVWLIAVSQLVPILPNEWSGFALLLPILLLTPIMRFTLVELADC